MVVTLADLIADGELDGYRAGAPRLNALADGVDAEVCRDARCAACGHAGLDYRPFVAETGRWSYRCFACCPKCGHAEEF